jgi:hypothetical protein
MGTSNICYANGVKYLTTIMTSGSSFTAVTTAKDARGGICFSAETMGMSGASFTTTYKDGSGKAIGTIMPDAGGSLVVTCAGGSPVTITKDCVAQSGMPAMGSQAMCMMGPCM